MQFLPSHRRSLVKFLRERYTGSGCYHAGDSTSAEAPSEVLEERLADAAEIVVAQQIGSENGNELLAPDEKNDDPIALERPGKEFASGYLESNIALRCFVKRKSEKADVGDTRLENQRVAMENVR